MNKEDVEFLKDLQHEMLTQDKVCQASPRFWVVRHTVRDYGINEEYADGYIVIGDDGEEYYKGESISNLETVCKWLKDDFEIDCEFNESNWIEVKGTFDDDDESLFGIEDVINHLEGLGYDQYQVSYYKDEERIVEDTMFLTNKSCKEHIQANSYHYNKPHSYAMTAWRSPQVEKLYKILENTNWDKIIEGDETNE